MILYAQLSRHLNIHVCECGWLRDFYVFPFLILNFHVILSHIRLSHLSSHQLLSQPSENLLKKKASNKFSSMKIKKMKRELPKMRNDHECESVKHYGRHKIIISFLKRVKAAQNSKKNHQDHHQWWTGMMENIFTNISSDIQVLKCFFVVYSPSCSTFISTALPEIKVEKFFEGQQNLI